MRSGVGVYQHCGEAHLHLAEFFHYNRRTALKISDAERAEDLLPHGPRQAPDLSADW
jgi:hypothetical protein